MFHYECETPPGTCKNKFCNNVNANLLQVNNKKCDVCKTCYIKFTSRICSFRNCKNRFGPRDMTTHYKSSNLKYCSLHIVDQHILEFLYFREIVIVLHDTVIYDILIIIIHELFGYSMDNWIEKLYNDCHLLRAKTR